MQENWVCKGVRAAILLEGTSKYQHDFDLRPMSHLFADWKLV